MRKFAVLAGIAGLFALGIAFAGVVLAQTSTTDQTVSVDISDTALLLTPSSPNLGVSSAFTLTAHNSGTFTYSLVLEPQGVVNQPITVNGSAARIDNIAPGTDVTQAWTVDTAGTYQLTAYTDTNATTSSVLTATLVVASSTVSATDTPAATTAATTAVTDTPAATTAATDTPAATTAATTAVTDTPAATDTAAVAVTDTPAATSISATGTISGTAEATLPQTGGPDDSLPTGVILITFGMLFVVGAMLVGRKLARR